MSLITRFGADHVEGSLPPLLRAVRDEGHIRWSGCADPMHGNTINAEGGRKTRRFDDILTEIKGFFQAHAERERGRAVCTWSSPATT